MKLKSLSYFFIAFAFVSCSKSDSSMSADSASNAAGVAGSMARFAIVGDYLYTVSTTNVKIFDIKTEADPVYKINKPFGVDIETIFPLGNTLFLGSSGGMYIYDIDNPLEPKMQSLYTHIFSCDPVVANEKFAYVTLSTGAVRCGRGLNQLEVIDVSNKKAPKMLKAISMVRPQGLALSGNDLFVCDDKVKWFDATNSPNIVQKGTIDVKANDAIIINKTLMLVGDKGLSQYDFSGVTPKFLSEIKIGD